jgi:hypothetical protein
MSNESDTTQPEPVVPARPERVGEMAEGKFSEGWRGLNVVQAQPISGHVPDPGGLPPAGPSTPVNSVETAPPAPPPDQGE